MARNLSPLEARRDMREREEARAERIALERYRGRYASREDLVRALHSEYALPRRGRQSCIVDTAPDDGKNARNTEE